MSGVPHGVEALVGAVLAHGADHDAVLHCHAAYLEWSEQLGHWLSTWLRRRGGPGRGILGRRVETHAVSSFIAQLGLCILSGWGDLGHFMMLLLA
jgi:hypothetical protein